MKTAAAYIRVSTDDQLEYSPESQLKQIRAYAEKNGFSLPDSTIFWEEEGRSGRQAEKRPEFMRMIRTSKEKPRPFDLILVWKFSRFARNREDSIVYKSMLRRQCGIEVISVSENIGDDKMSILIEAMIEAMDEYYSINLAEEVKRGMAEKAFRGEPLTYAPFGYSMVQGRLVPDQNAEYVRLIYNEFLAGYGFREIAEKCNSLGLRTRFGNPLETRRIAYILKNPVYTGKIRWNLSGSGLPSSKFSEPIFAEGKHSPLISAADWESVQQRLGQIKKAYPGSQKKRAAREYALRGLFHCDRCGGALTAVSHGTAMQCHRYAKGICHVSHSITIPKATDWTICSLQADLETLEIQISPTVPVQKEQKLQISRSIAKEEKRLLRIRESYERGIDSLEEYQQSKKACTERLNQLNSQLSVNSQETNPQDRRQDFFSFLLSDDIPEEEKNLALRTLLEKIVFSPEEAAITIYYAL